MSVTFTPDRSGVTQRSAHPSQPPRDTPRLQRPIRDVYLGSSSAQLNTAHAAHDGQALTYAHLGAAQTAYAKRRHVEAIA